MTTKITKLDITNEVDILLAHRRAMQITKFAGINISEQTRFATAISEISRNALEFCKSGEITFSITLSGEKKYTCEALITDCGKGIKDIETILKRDPQSYKGRGIGIVFSKKLVDIFRITSNASGTKVTLGMKVPVKAKPINNLVIQGWINYIKNEQPLTAYEELKVRNINLMQLTEELKEEQARVEKHSKEIQLLNEKLVKTNSYMEEFTYTVSHDLKTPLTTLKLAFEFLDEAEDAESKMEYMQMIGRAAKRLEKTIQGLVEILDLQTNDQSIVKKIDLHSFFTDIKEGFSTYILAKSVAFEDSFMIDELWYIEPYLTSIFTNLISNSIKYRVVERPLVIRVSTRRSSGKILLTFTDNAEGIDLVKNGPRIFTPFTRFTTRQEGKGIGLYIIKKIIEKNDGRIEVESTPGVGTSFKIYLNEYPAVIK